MELQLEAAVEIGPENIGFTFTRWMRHWKASRPGPAGVERDPGGRSAEIVELALDEPELSPREVATRFTDVNKYFVWRHRFIGCSRRTA